MKITAMKLSLGYFLFFVCRIQAGGQLMQFPESPDGEEDPYPEGAPIDDYLIVMMILGMLLAFYFLMMKKRLHS